MFGNKDVYKQKFPNGFAGAYRDYINKVVLENINLAPTYLNDLWLLTMNNLQKSYNSPDVAGRSDVAGRRQPGFFYPTWERFYNQMAVLNYHYWKDGIWTWDYKHEFTWLGQNPHEPEIPRRFPVYDARVTPPAKPPLKFGQRPPSETGSGM
ncbi:hypothetical protein HYALB_00005064 [Hymenoscyphus albidus]|uniref:Uncharacterized protein n=1 Tax=Hymenoscyphus albidus TaxID=595503 RepID=A0A9N9LU41_9HELO|nr:hypothetical protein HYALB_00005064 [Hymenoscyphus albidus]